MRLKLYKVTLIKLCKVALKWAKTPKVVQKGPDFLRITKTTIRLLRRTNSPYVAQIRLKLCKVLLSCAKCLDYF